VDAFLLDTSAMNADAVHAAAQAHAHACALAVGWVGLPQAIKHP